jgi:Flp pilus assembly protein TadD
MIDAYKMRAEMNLETQKYELAIQDYDRIIALSPNDGGNYNDRGLANMKLAHYHQAISDFTKAIDLKEKNSEDSQWLYSSYSNRAGAYLKNRDFAEAIADFTKAIQLYLESQIILMKVTQFRAIYSEYDSLSNDDLSKLLWKKMYPNWEYKQFAEMFLKQDDKKGWASTIMPELYVNRGDAYLLAGNWKKALREFERAMKGYPDYAEAIDRWRSIAKGGDTDIHLDFKTISQSDTNVIGCWIKTNKYAQEYLENYEINCVSRQINQLESINYNESGKGIRMNGYRGWQRIVPDSFGEILFNHLCQSELDSGSVPVATKEMHEVSVAVGIVLSKSIVPPLADLPIKSGILVKAMLDGSKNGELRKIEDSRAELAAMPKSPKCQSKDARLKNAAGLMAVSKEDTSEAVKNFHESYLLCPNDVEILNNLGFALMRAGDYDNAEKALLRSLSLAPDRTNAWANLGQVLSIKGDVNSGSACFLNAFRYTKSVKKTTETLQNFVSYDPFPDTREAARVALEKYRGQQVATPEHL